MNADHWMIVMNDDVERFVRFCESELGKKVMERETEYVYKELRNCEVILDVGCGIGSFEQYLPCLNIIGLDSSKKMLQEAMKRSNKTFVLGDAEYLEFKDYTFDAIFTVTTLEFTDDYRKAVNEITRVTKRNGKVLAMILNPKSEYFRDKVMRTGSYFKRIKHTDFKEIRDYVSQFYHIIKEEYFLGIRGQDIFDTNDKRYASLYVVVGVKN